MLNTEGPKMEPCGTLCHMSRLLILKQSRQWKQSRYLNQFKTVPESPTQLSNLSKSIVWSTVLNAALRSSSISIEMKWNDFPFERQLEHVMSVLKLSRALQYLYKLLLFPRQLFQLRRSSWSCCCIGWLTVLWFYQWQFWWHKSKGGYLHSFLVTNNLLPTPIEFWSRRDHLHDC